MADSGTCARHVHVGVPSRDLGVQVLVRLRPWLAPLLAVTASSPIAGSRWPTAVPPAVWPDAAHDTGVRRLIDANGGDDSIGRTSHAPDAACQGPSPSSTARAQAPEPKAPRPSAEVHRASGCDGEGAAGAAAATPVVTDSVVHR